MSRRLPPLNALRAFEAAARHLSFTRAAGELNVTQAAVSHQVKALEQRLGVELFKRRARGLLLTDGAQEYLPAVREAFDLIDRATRRLDQRRAGRTSQPVLTITTMDSLAAKWLVPRLGGFQDLHPEVEVRLSTSDHVVDLADGDIDMGVRYGRGRYPGLVAHRLMTEELFPVCAPALLDGPVPVREPEDLRHHRVLHDDMARDWRAWLDAAGLPDLEPSRSSTFTRSNLLIQAAIEGQGIALGRSVLVADDLAAGRLVKPFDLALPSPNAYFLVYAEERGTEPKIAAFRDWLIAETAAEGAPAAATAAVPPISGSG